MAPASTTMTLSGDDLLDQYLAAFGPWDTNRIVTIPMVRRERLEALVKRINEIGQGTAKVTKIVAHESEEGYIDGRIEYELNRV